MLQEDKRKQLDEIVKKMVANNESDSNIQLVVDDFKSKYDVPETQGTSQVVSKSPFLAQEPQQPQQVQPAKTAQDFGRQPIDVSKKDIGVTDYLKSAGRGLLAGGFNTLSNVASVAKPFFPNTGSFSGGDFLNKVQDLKYVAKDLNNQNMQEAIRTRQPQLAGISNVGQLLGGEVANPINYTPIPGGSGLKGRLLRGGINALQGQISYNPELNPGSRLETAATDLGFGALMPADIGKSISNLSKNRVSNGIKNLFPEDSLASKATNFISGFQKSGLSKAEKKASDIANKIIKGEKMVTKKQVDALADIDTKGVKDFYGIENRINETIESRAKKITDTLQSKYLDTYDINEFTKTYNSKLGNQKVNFIDDALETLKSFYKDSMPEKESSINNLIYDSKTKGLTLDQINDLAKEYGRVKNAFNPKGELYVGKDKYEIVRKELKDAWRNKLLPEDKGLIEYDKRISALYDIKYSVGKTIKQLQTIVKNAEEKGVLEKAVSAIKKFINIGTTPYDKMNVYEWNEGLEKALKEFKKQAKKAGINPDLPEFKPRDMSIPTRQQLDEQARLANIPRALEAERLKSEGKILGNDFVANQPTINYSLQRGQGVQLRPDEGFLPKKDYRVERPYSYDFPETKTNKIVRNPNLSSPEIKGTDYQKLASEMKTPKSPTQVRVKAITEKKAVKKNESPVSKPIRTLSNTSEEARKSFDETWKKAYGNRPATKKMTTALDKEKEANSLLRKRQEYIAKNAGEPKSYSQQDIDSYNKKALKAGKDFDKLNNPRTLSKATKTTDLASEAKKYKSAEEFVKAQGTPVYHGTASDFEMFDSKFKGYSTGAESAKGAFWFTDDTATAKAYAIYSAEDAPVQRILKEADNVMKQAQKTNDPKLWDKYDELVKKSEELSDYNATYERRQKLANVKEAYLKGEFLEVDAKGKSPQELSTDDNIDSWLNNKIQEAIKKGKAGLKIKNIDDAVGLYDRPSTHYAVFNPEQIKTKSELEKIWKQANNK